MPALAALPLLLGLGSAPRAADAAAPGFLTEPDLEYLWSGGPPRLPERPGGWREYYFSSDLPGGSLAPGNDANACTPDAPCLTTARMLSLAAPGAHFLLDAGDDWNTPTTFTTSFVLDQATIGCPKAPDDVCVWFSTTAADPALDPVAWGKPPGVAGNCMNVLSDGTDRGWVFFDGFAVSCDAAGTASDGDGPDTNRRGKLWCANCPVVVSAADGSDNAATAHAGGITVISGSSPLVVAANGAGNNPVVATAGGGAVLVFSRQPIALLQTASHLADVVYAVCGGVCSRAAGAHTPAVALIGPSVECGAGCDAASSLLELNPDAVDPVSPTATASALVAFASFRHARSAGTHALRPVAMSANERVWFRGYGNTYATLDHVWYHTNTQLDAAASLDVEDVGFLAAEPEGGPGADGAILHFADPDWATADVRFRLAHFVYDNEGGTASQCYLEDGAADVVAATLGGCQDAIAAAGPRGAWSVNEGAVLSGGEEPPAEVFVADLPNGIVLPAFVTGSTIRGVHFGGSIAARVDVVPGSDLDRVDLRVGSVAVAVLSSAALDAADVDVSSLRFGPDGAAPMETGSEFDDVNGDGLADVVSHYRTGETGLALGDGEACVAGKRLDRIPFAGCGAVEVVSGAPSCGFGPELTLVLAPLAWRQRRRRAPPPPL